MAVAVAAFFLVLGLGMIFNVRGFGERVVAAIVALGAALGSSGTPGTKIAARKRLFSVGWGALFLSFGVAVLVLAALH